MGQRGFFEIGVYHLKNGVNLGTLWRSAYQLGAAGIFTIGRKYLKQCSDTCKALRHIPYRHYKDFDEFLSANPMGARIIGVEMDGQPLADFTHPQQAIYLLGAEDHGLPQNIMDRCWTIVEIESVRRPSFNVAVAGSIVMYHRLIQNGNP